MVTQSHCVDNTHESDELVRFFLIVHFAQNFNPNHILSIEKRFQMDSLLHLLLLWFHFSMASLSRDYQRRQMK